MIKRTNIDFTNFSLTINECEYLTYVLKNDVGSIIKFITDDSHLYVVGDYGNWIFNRNFIPVNGGSVLDYYWVRLLRERSTQNPFIFSKHKTCITIDAMIVNIEVNYPNDSQKKIDLIKYFKNSKEYVDNEQEYLWFVSEHKPNWYLNDIIVEYDYMYDILVVFDAFEEICRTLPKNNNLLFDEY